MNDTLILILQFIVMFFLSFLMTMIVIYFVNRFDKYCKSEQEEVNKEILEDTMREVNHKYQTKMDVNARHENMEDSSKN